MSKVDEMCIRDRIHIEETEPMEQHYFQPEIECAGQEDMKKTQSERLRKICLLYTSRCV